MLHIKVDWYTYQSEPFSSINCIEQSYLKNIDIIFGIFLKLKCEIPENELNIEIFSRYRFPHWRDLNLPLYICMEYLEGICSYQVILVYRVLFEFRMLELTPILYWFGRSPLYWPKKIGFCIRTYHHQCIIQIYKTM